MPNLQAALDELTGPKGPVPGLSAVVVRGREVLWAGASGYADVERREPARLGTVYLWFSMTKIATATAVVQLAERGRLGLDEPVTTYVPELASPEPITIRHLLEHSGGLPNPIPVRWVHPASENGPPAHEFAMKLLSRGRRRKKPGVEARYSNLGYLALGEVVAAAAGESYEDYVRRNLLEPLGMTRTNFSYDEALAPHAATGYQLRRSPMTPLFRLLLPRGIYGHRVGRFVSFTRFCVDGPAYGGLIGSAEDAARFLALHAGGGGEVLSAEGVRSMQRLAMHGRKLDVGLGWFRRRGDRDLGTPYVEHLGGGGGFFNMMRLFTDRALGVVVMGNATAYDHQRIAQAVLEAFPA